MKVIYLAAVLLIAFLFVEAPPALEAGPELVVQTGHSGQVSSVAFSPDSKLIASGSWDNTIKIWDAATGVQLRALNGHTNSVTSVAFSPDGKLLASASMDYTAKIWDALTGQVLHTLTKHSLQVQSVAISRDNTTLATAGTDNLIILWNLQTGKEIRTLSGHESQVSSVAFGPDGTTLASASWDHFVRVWNTTTGEVIHKLEAPGALMSVAFSADGRTIASAGFRSIIKAWDASSGQELYTQVAGAEWVFPVAFSPDSKTLVTGSNSLDEHTVKAWDARTGKELPLFAAYKHSRIFSLAFSPDGGTLALGGDTSTIALLDTTTAATRLTLEGHSVAVNSVALSPDGQTLAVSGQGPVIKLWDLQAQAPPRNLGGQDYYFVNAIAFSPDGKLLASASSDRMVRLWNLSTGTAQPLAGHEAIVNCVAFSPDAKLLASGADDNTIKLWNTGTGALLATLKGHIDSVRAIAFSPDGKSLASASADTTIKIWDVASGKELRTLEGHSNWVQAVAYSPDGKTLASGSVDTTIKLWDLSKEVEPRTLSGHSSVVQSVAFSPHGESLVSGSWDRTVRVWNVALGRQMQMLAGHSDRVVSVAFHRDGRTIASGGKDGQTRLWNAQNGKALASLTALDENDWAVVAPDGRFEASPEGMKLMHFVQANQAIPLDSFFEKFYRVHLLGRLDYEESAPLYLRGGFGNLGRVAGPPAKATVDIAKQISPPPLVRIVSPKTQSVDTDTFQVIVEAVDQGAGIDGIRLYQNEKVVGGDERQLVHTPSNRKTFDVILDPGTNVFRAVAFNRNRIASITPAEITVELRKPEASSDLYILAIGLNEYKNSNYDLNYGVADAQAFADAVEQRASGLFKRIYKQVILSPDANSISTFATRSLIESAFNKVIAAAKRPDAFVFYYAGHGVMSMGDDRNPPQFYIVPYDVTQIVGNDVGLEAKGISAEMLKELSLKVPAQKKLLILDACYSGGALAAFQGRGGLEQDDALAQLNRSTGIFVLAATSGRQIATEFDSLGHGLFTYALLQGLAGEATGNSSGTGKITVLQLATYLNNKVPQLTQKYRGKQQYPTTFVSGQDFPLGVK